MPDVTGSVINKTGCKAGTMAKGKFIKMANISTNKISLLQGEGFVKRKYSNGS